MDFTAVTLKYLHLHCLQPPPPPTPPAPAPPPPFFLLFFNPGLLCIAVSWLRANCVIFTRGRAKQSSERAGAGVDFQVFSEHLPPTSPICRHLPRFRPHFLLQAHTHTHKCTHIRANTRTHPVKNNQQPPISFWHTKGGTRKKKRIKKHKC